MPVYEESRRGGPIRLGAGGTAVVRLTPTQRGRAEIWLGYVPPGTGLQMSPRILRYRFEVQ